MIFYANVRPFAWNFNPIFYENLLLSSTESAHSMVSMASVKMIQGDPPTAADYI